MFMPILIICVASSQAISFHDVIDDEWNTFKLQYQKQYRSPREDQYRFNIFIQNKDLIAKHNALFARGSVSFSLKMNNFGDLTVEEFSKLMNGYNQSLNTQYRARKDVGASFISPSNVELPNAVDWRDQGAVTAVKNQGQCGSCWAFSATGSLEGQHFRKTGVLTSLSEQNLMDCTMNYGNMGCDGGLMDPAFEYIRDNKGIDTERSYPYEERTRYCRFNPNTIGATDTGFVDLQMGNEHQLKEAIATIGPVSVAMDASHSSFQFYSTGIYYEYGCSSTQLDHGVLVVGYGTTYSDDYWIVKNSWGNEWGEDGYVRMARNRNNNCGIASQASYPLV